MAAIERDPDIKFDPRSNTSRGTPRETPYRSKDGAFATAKAMRKAEREQDGSSCRFVIEGKNHAKTCR